MTPSPRTREHLEILRLLGLAGGVVVLTKCDLADPTWLDLVEEEVRSLVRGTFLENAAVVDFGGDWSGVRELKDALASFVPASNRVTIGRVSVRHRRSFTVARSRNGRDGHGRIGECDRR